MALCVVIYSSVEQQLTRYGRVVELVDSLDSGSSVHYGRAGSSPASPTKRSEHYRCDFQEVDIYGVLFLYSGVL